MASEIRPKRTTQKAKAEQRYMHGGPELWTS
jgi:hypothetical protein